MNRIRKLLLYAGLTFWGVIAFQPSAKALILDATAAIVKNCLVRNVSGLSEVVDTFFWAIRILFVLVVVGIVYILWSKRDDNENLQNWLRSLGFLIVGAGLIGAFETFFLGSAADAQASCSSGGQTQVQQGNPNTPGVPPVPQ